MKAMGPEEQMRNSLTVRMPDDMMNWVIERAWQTRTTASAYVRDILDERMRSGTEAPKSPAAAGEQNGQ